MAEWQPIESAPMDWTDVLVFSPSHEDTNTGGVFCAWYDPEAEGWYAHQAQDLFGLEPTHWQPLPEPPTTKGEGE